MLMLDQVSPLRRRNRMERAVDDKIGRRRAASMKELPIKRRSIRTFHASIGTAERSLGLDRSGWKAMWLSDEQ